MNEDIVIIIPAYNPDGKFIKFLNGLCDSGYKHIIVVDDGSREESLHYFEDASRIYGCQVVRHYVNLGQGRAFKSAFNYFVGQYSKNEKIIGVIECDCDGQHAVEDVDRCARLLRSNPQNLILGVRDFTSKDVPFRSRFGNICTSMVFKLFCGLDIADTQTGLKGIPKSFIPRLMETQGERFEYASSVLLETKKAGVRITQFPIRTIYIDGNATSHFNAVLDSIRIYSLILGSLVASLSSSVIDLSVFGALVYGLKGKFPLYIVMATYLAKVASCTYSYFVNKTLVFENKEKGIQPLCKWILLCVIQATLSGLLTSWLVGHMLFPEIISKVIVDLILFFFSFQIQNRWVFTNYTK